VVYIHGFGNTFEQAAEQAATLGVALRVPGVMAMFSWPSQGKQGPLSYLRDISSLENSEDELAEFLARLGRLAGPGHVHIIAHSLGVNGFLRSMQSATARAQILAPKMHFGQIIFAAPDVNARLFRRLATTVAALSSRTTLYIAHEDMAVKASEFLHGDHRIGLLPTDPLTGAMDTVEVMGRPSNLDVGHSYFRDAPGVLKDIQTLIYFGESPKKRQQRNGAPVPDEPLRKQAWIIHNQN
jgi:esterase/lipase superfamily enzyme